MPGPNLMKFRPAVAAATTANLSATFAAGTTPNKTTLTGAAAAFVVDGYTAALNDRILVKNQTTGLQNGVYTVTTVGSASSGKGPVATVSGTVGGTGYLSGTYTNVSLSGGTGTGAKATIVVGGTGPIASVGALTGGSNYSNGQFVNVTLTGGSGSGAKATLIIQGGSVAALTLTNPGTGYTVGNTLSATLSTTGAIATIGAITGGSLYTDGTYTNVTLTGGTGTGAKATVEVDAGEVIAVTITTAGTGYTVADVLTASAASIGGTGSGFSVPVATITPTGSGFSIPVSAIFGAVTGVTITTAGTGYTVADVLTVNPYLVGTTGSGFSTTVATVVPSNWVLTRAQDVAESYQIDGLAVFVGGGSTNLQTAWVQVVSPVVLDTTALTFVKFVG